MTNLRLIVTLSCTAIIAVGHGVFNMRGLSPPPVPPPISPPLSFTLTQDAVLMYHYMKNMFTLMLKLYNIIL